MSDPRDEHELPPLSDELRALYRQVTPPPLADDLAAADERTKQTVRWMQAAWRELEPPRAITPPVLGRPRLGVRRASRGRRLAIAAAVLLLAGAALWRALVAREHARPALVARVPERIAGSAVEFVDVRSDQVELRSGPVRLLLLDPPPSEVHTPPGS